MEREEIIYRAKIRTVSNDSIQGLIDVLNYSISQGATNIRVRDDRSNSEGGKLYGVWLDMYRVRSEKEMKEIKIAKLEKELAELKK